MISSTIAAAETELYLTLLQLSQHYPITAEWLAKLPTWLAAIKDKKRYAHAPYYQSVIENLPIIDSSRVKANLNSASITAEFDWTYEAYKQTTALLKKLMPWRKGPFAIGQVSNDISKDHLQIHIDTEWHSDWKWSRIAPHISDVTGKRLLDVGGGSGYHGWRMAGLGASTVIVIDPSCLFYHQFMAIRHFIGDNDRNRFGRFTVNYIPVGLEELPSDSQLFHTVFCMGVLYHRASPFEHLEQLYGQLVKGGELVLETLVIEGDETDVLVPIERYAQMNNVYFIPSVAALSVWLNKVGFVDVRCVDITATSIKEQRTTSWMTYHSLEDYLDPDDKTKTLEGYPSPLRATLIAKRP